MITLNKKKSQKIFFKLSSDANIINLEFLTNTLNTLYLNNILFIERYHENRDEELINIFAKERRELKNNEYRNELHQLIAHYEVNTDESNLVLGHFIIVALYSYYERTLKSILLKTGLCSKEEYKKLYKYSFLKKFFNEKLKFKYEDWENEKFILLEELRCLNNCIKHSGFVNNELCKVNNTWLIDQEIGNISEHISKFMEIPHTYLKIVVNKISEIYFKG